jgi:hypothetical protein
LICLFPDFVIYICKYICAFICLKISLIISHFANISL